MNHIILFDGVCHFCNSSVQFILKRDSKQMYHFASLQSEAGKSLLKKHNIPEDINSFVLIEGDHYFTKSSAALRVCRNLSGAYRFLYSFKVIPAPLRDILYHIIANNRYKWFGKQESCMLPSPEVRKRFLD
ncbi:thiol-disulfide oxidoreductase DCC family protein [Fredinandcohnia sp. QZ13]|uniref:thiol-disulfide oxidoreductase DCC family protein n=1 Tax=Fredinandcohnia sp. QZ13 TaxID=3073144 RepID=UPI0028532A20|nr:thiol-disulfide oxidoreductase DCC family protein [Fredinandcohnia sp. QZ13]MDR4889297.1 thiol-disulfide oxidoreductase DCC family protein [Fredinandcohnia sp. QZ13]